MASSIYTETRAVAQELLEEFAQGELLLTQTPATIADAEKPWRRTDGEARVIRLSGVSRQVERRYIDGTTILGTERQATVAPVGTLVSVGGVASSGSETIAPHEGHRLSIDGTSLRIKRVVRVPDAGVPSVFVLIAGT